MDYDMFGLPWATLVTLASGYAGYYVANIGLREHHKTVDITFSTLVFGFFATIVYVLVLWAGSVHTVANIAAQIVAPLAAFATAILLGIWWTKVGREWMTDRLREHDVSHGNDLPSAWLSMFSVTDVTGRQLQVKLADGTWLKCDDLRKFGTAPNGPCVLGGAGDILMYVTHIKKPGARRWREIVGTLDTEWGYEASYLPASQITRIEYRRRPTAWPAKL